MAEAPVSSSSIDRSDLRYRQRLTAAIRALAPELHADRAEVLEPYGGLPPQPTEQNGIVADDPLLDLLQEHPDLQSRLALLTQYTASKWLLEQELIASGKWPKNVENPDAYLVAGTLEAVGVCFSGGGIRSATFNLGVLQALAQLDKLKDIRYLSTVSGGGYIHLFLAAWIKRAGIVQAERNPPPTGPPPAPPTDPRPGLEQVRKKLLPIPSPRANQVLPPEPIRWLRRYSNYLSPSINLLGPDVWTMAEIWIRNTVLNLIILVSFLMCLLALPRFFTTEWSLHWHPHYDLLRLLCLLSVVAALGAAGLLWYSLPRYLAAPEGAAPTADVVEQRAGNNRTRPRDPHLLVLAWLVVSICISPVVYRLSLPGGSAWSPFAQEAYQPVTKEAGAGAQIVITSKDATSVALSTCRTADGCGKPAEAAQSRLQRAWPVYKPECILPASVFSLWKSHPGAAPKCRTYKGAHDDHRLRNPATGVENPLTLLYDFYPLLCCIFCGAVLDSRKKTTKGGRRKAGAGWLVPWSLSAILGGAFAAVSLYAMQLFFFALTFLVNQTRYIPALGIAVLPSYLLAVPFIALELSTAFMGKLFASAQREWAARLRAISFLWGLGWLIVGGLSLLGPALVGKIAAVAAVKYTVWLAWAGSTAAGVLLGKSRSTGGKSKEGHKASGFDMKEWIIKVTPAIFALGTFLLLATVNEWLLRSDQAAVHVYPLERWAVLTAVCLCTAALFSWRIDVNEFSMNAFYRDRLARCYAGASNPQRRPNRFTGFDVEDTALRVADLLPKGWTDADKPAGEKDGTYEGPFPIFCSAINLTTGRDLAYQERKAGSFAFTPLYSGYSTGWTDGDSPKLQYNGFVRTLDHIKKGRGITVASAVAISGAAASPNMGFHSNPAMAFLMTIFNVRLGWWLRNTRVPGPHDEPRLSLLQLLNELRGHTTDTAHFVYLSDGGHFENMGLHELLRRRCRRVLVCDAESDGSLLFDGIGQAIRKARLDLGIEIRLDHIVAPADQEAAAAPAPVAPAPVPSVLAAPAQSPDSVTPTGVEGLLKFQSFPGNHYHALEGEIIYPEDPSHPGKLIYIKSILTGDEPSDILNYHRMHPSFPFDTTLNQFYTESQFESYRRLGEHIVCRHEISEWINQNL